MIRSWPLITTRVMIAVIGAAVLTSASTAKGVTAQAPQPAIQGASVPAGATRTFGEITITNELGGDVTITLAENVLTIATVAGTPPFVVAPPVGAACASRVTAAGTGALCPVSPGMTVTLVAVVPPPGTRAGPITLSPSSGPGGIQTTVHGTGFAVGDTVLVDILGPSFEPEGSTLTTVTVGQDRTFAAAVTIPQGGRPEPITIMAYPASFGPRSRERVLAAPKATFTVTGPGGKAASLPDTGTGVQVDTSVSAGWHLGAVAAIVLASVGLVVSRRSCRR